MPDQWYQNSGGGTQVPVYFSVLRFILNQSFKKVSQIISMCGQDWEPLFWVILVINQSGSHCFYIPTRTVSLNVLPWVNILSSPCYSFLLPFVSFCLEKDTSLAIYLKGDFNNNISDVKFVMLIWNLHTNSVRLLFSVCTF